MKFTSTVDAEQTISVANLLDVDNDLRLAIEGEDEGACAYLSKGDALALRDHLVAMLAEEAAKPETAKPEPDAPLRTTAWVETRDGAQYEVVDARGVNLDYVSDDSGIRALIVTAGAEHEARGVFPIECVIAATTAVAEGDE